jgi:hypothetical protein
MAFTSSINNFPATGTVAMYTVMATLVAAGWTVKSSSDGTTYNSTGNQITSGNSGAAGLGNTNAWFRIQAPIVGTQKREFTFQRTTSNPVWRIKYSASAGFIGGSPGATQTPTATDETIILGSGTDAAPTGATMFNTDASYRFSIVACDSSLSYSFYWFANSYGTQSITSAFLMDVLKSGSYSISDTDPCVVFAAQGSNSITTAPFLYGNSKALLNTTYVAVVLNVVLFNSVPNSNDLAFPPGLATTYSVTNPFTYGDNLLPAIWGRSSDQTSPFGYKGISSLITLPSTLRATLDTLTTTTTSDHIFLGNIVFLWTGAVPVL